MASFIFLKKTIRHFLSKQHLVWSYSWVEVGTYPVLFQFSNHGSWFCVCRNHNLVFLGQGPRGIAFSQVDIFKHRAFLVTYLSLSATMSGICTWHPPIRWTFPPGGIFLLFSWNCLKPLALCRCQKVSLFCHAQSILQGQDLSWCISSVRAFVGKQCLA